jgi:hypothetical protein
MTVSNRPPLQFTVRLVSDELQLFIIIVHLKNRYFVTAVFAVFALK